MLVSEIQTRVKRQFGDEAGAQITDADIIRWINDAQREIALANNLTQTTATTNLVANQEDYAKPSNILTLHTVRANGIRLKALSRQEMDELVTKESEGSGTPTHYYVWANEIRLFPKPDASATDGLKLEYTAVPAEVSAAGDTPALPVQYHNRILEYCLAQAYELDDNLDSYQVKMSQFRSGVQEMKDNAEWGSRDFYPHISVSADDTSAYGDYY